MNTENQNMWHLIVLEEPSDYLNNRSLEKILKILEQSYNYRYLALNEFEGAGIPGLFYNLREVINTKKIFSFNEVYSILQDVDSFDWVDFFLFLEYPAGWSKVEGNNYTTLMSHSNGLVRGVDNGYIFVYTPNVEVIETIKRIYPNSEIEKVEAKPLCQFKVPF